MGGRVDMMTIDAFVAKPARIGIIHGLAGTERETYDGRNPNSGH